MLIYLVTGDRECGRRALARLISTESEVRRLRLQESVQQYKTEQDGA
jgi:hypothetical protein